MAAIDEAFPDADAAAAALRGVQATISAFRRGGAADLVAWACDWACSVQEAWRGERGAGADGTVEARGDEGDAIELHDVAAPARCLFALRVLRALAAAGGGVGGESTPTDFAKKSNRPAHAVSPQTHDRML